MRKNAYFLASSLAFALVLAGCGGSTGPRTSTITGTVLDVDGVQVTNARVWTLDASTVTSTSGAYVLDRSRAGEVKVIAEISRNGVLYRGVNWSLNFENEQTQNVTIVVGSVSEAATIVGTVRDRDGFLLENVSVWAFSEIGSSIRAFTDRNGRYSLVDLLPNVLYTISATGLTYKSDQQDITLSAREARTLEFVMGNPGVPVLTPPQNFFVQTWVSPTDPTRSVEDGDRYAVARSKYGRGDLADAVVHTVDSRTHLIGNTIVEADLYWDWVVDPEVLGYAIYRGAGNTLIVDFLEFSPDPMSGSFVDIGLSPNSTYTYGATSLATLFGDFDDTESDLSDVYVVDTLDRLDLRDVLYGPLTFRWLSGSGSDDYSVFLFDEFPGVLVSDIWNDYNTPSFGTSKVYNGPSLQSGQTYYYYVVGTANAEDSITISQVDWFVAP